MRDVWLGVLFAVVLMGLAYGAAYLLLYLLVDPNVDLWLALFSAVLELVLLVPVWWFVKRKYHVPLAKALGFRRFKPWWLAVAVGLLIAYFVFNAYYAAILAALGLEMQRDVGPTLRELSSPWPLVFSIVILAPLVEEVFFRGFVFNGLRGRMDWWWAAVISGALFAAAHLDPLFLLPAFLMGFLFAFLYQKTNSIWPGMIVHFLVNSLAMIVALAAVAGDGGRVDRSSYHMTPDEFRQWGHAAVDWLARYMEDVEGMPVVSTVAPGEVRGAVAAEAARGGGAVLRRAPRHGRDHRAGAHPLAVAQLLRLLPGEHVGAGRARRVALRRAERAGDAVGDEPGRHRTGDPRDGLGGGPARSARRASARTRPAAASSRTPPPARRSARCCPPGSGPPAMPPTTAAATAP